MEKLPIYNCLIEEGDGMTGIYAISFVDYPANEVDFISLKANKSLHLNRDDKKQVLTGVVLKPDQLIYRNSELGEHYIRFSSCEIEKIARKMMKTGVAIYNTTHQHDSQLSGNYLFELWIIENPEIDKSKALGFTNLPKGTLMCSYKIEDADYWQKEVMTGNVKGFSLEGFFNQELCLSKLINMKKKRFQFSAFQKGVMNAIGISKEVLSDIEKVEVEDATDSGITFREFTLSDGKIVLVDSDGFATLDGEQMPAGEHTLADGNIMVVDENGNFVETKEATAATTDPEETTAAQTLRVMKHQIAKMKTNQKLEEVITDTETVESLKAKIAELEAKLAEITDTASEAVAEIENLRKKTPSATPATSKSENVDLSKMSHTDRMAQVMSQSLQRKNKTK